MQSRLWGRGLLLLTLAIGVWSGLGSGLVAGGTVVAADDTVAAAGGAIAAPDGMVAASDGAVAAADGTVAAPARDFTQCLADLQRQAVALGVDAALVERVVARTEHLDRVLALDRQQPEFTVTFADYLGQRVTPLRVAQGRALLTTHGPLLARVSQETGVPANYVVALWGMETNFGSYQGRTFIPSALATLACDDRRADYFTAEFLALLQLLQAENLPLDRLLGSWAGAMGHVQFMPSVYLQYALDADGDGQRDLFNSLPDALLSAGNYLQQSGWDSNYRWGREVLLPADFAYEELARGLSKSLIEWRRLGVRDVSGGLVADLPLSARLLMPVGHRGPAFLVYPNFDVIMTWNRSEFFALAVGHLADRLAGAGPLHTPIPTDVPRLSRAQVESLQRTLNEQGFDSGAVDGILGPATRSAIRAYQLNKGLIPDGFPDRALLQRLLR